MGHRTSFLNKKLSFIIIILLLALIAPLIIGTAAAQAPIVEWNKTYGGGLLDRFNSVVQTSDGGYIAAGTINSAGAGIDDGWLVKLSSTGGIEWNKTYGGGSLDRFSSVVQTSDGGYIAAGEIGSAGAGGIDGWLVKLSSTGVIEWNKTYGGSSNDYFRSVVQTSDGGYIAAGYIGSAGAGNEDGWLVKVNSTGGIEWNKTYGGGSADYFRSVVQTSDGGYIAAGFTWSVSVFSDSWLLKLTSTGDIVWNNTYAGKTHEIFYSVSLTSDGGCLAAGNTYYGGTSPGGGWTSYDGWLVKVNTGIDNQMIIGGIESETIRSAVQTNDGGYIAVGDAWDDTTQHDGWLVKVTSTGGVEWNNTYGGGSADYFHSVVQTSDGGYIIAGEIFIAGTKLIDGWLIKISAPQPSTTTTCPPYTVDPCDCAAYGYQTPCTYWLLPGCNQPAPPGYNPQAAPTTTTTDTTADTTTATTTTTETTTTTASPTATATTTPPATSAPTTTTATTTTPASGVLIAVLCGLLVVVLMLRRNK